MHPPKLNIATLESLDHCFLRQIGTWLALWPSSRPWVRCTDGLRDLTEAFVVWESWTVTLVCGTVIGVDISCRVCRVRILQSSVQSNKPPLKEAMEPNLSLGRRRPELTF